MYGTIWELDLDVCQENMTIFTREKHPQVSAIQTPSQSDFGEASYLHLPNVILSEWGPTARTFPVAKLKVPLNAW
jgi:hypothetical protein